jgi:hypothetical protein
MNKALLHEGKVRDHLSDRSAVTGGLTADGHGLTITFDDEHVDEAGARQKRIDLEEMRLVTRSKRDRDRVLWNTTRCAFASGVDCLGNLRPFGEVGPDDDVVTEIGCPVGRFACFGRRCR